jgi:hypothetical protein
MMIINCDDSANLLIIKQEKHFVLDYLIVKKINKNQKIFFLHLKLTLEIEYVKVLTIDLCFKI